MSIMQKFNIRRRAAAGSQYALILGLIAVVALASVGNLGRSILSLLTTAGNRLAGQVVNSAVSAPPAPLAGMVTISPASISQAEGNSGTTNFTYTVTRSGDETAAEQVDWSVSGGTAVAADFQGGVLPSGSVTIPANATSTTITVPVAGDSSFEADETFTVNLTGISGGITTLGSPSSASGTITNDDSAPNITIVAASADKAEGNSGITSFTFTMTRNGSSPTSDTLTYTVTSSAANGADFQGGSLPTGQVNLPAGTNNSGTFPIYVVGDTTIEPDETFTVTLSNPTGNSVIGSPSSATGTIRDDDAIVISGSGTAGSPWQWSNGTFATSCAQYLSANAPGGYNGVAASSSNDGVYRIDLDGGSNTNALNVFCDQGNGGYMLVMKTRTQGYSDAIWSGTTDINQPDCVSTSATNSTNCKIGALYTWTGWTTLRGENRITPAFSTITPFNSGSSLYSHLNGSAITDSRMSGFMRALFPGATGSSPYAPAYGWNRVGASDAGAQRYLYTQRMVSDIPGVEGFFIGGYSGGCGNFSVTGNNDCRSSNTITIWFWLK